MKTFLAYFGAVHLMIDLSVLLGIALMWRCRSSGDEDENVWPSDPKP